MSHAKLGPSAAKRWMTCTASYALIEKTGAVSESGPAALEGSAAHTVLEAVLMRRLMEVGHRFEPGRYSELCKEVEQLREPATDEV